MNILIRVSGVIVRGKRILLLKRTKKHSKYPLHWGLPGGTLQTPGTPLSEFLENRVDYLTGMKFKVKQKIWFYEGIDKAHHALTHVYLGETKGDINKKNEEVEEIGWFTSEEAENLDLAFSDWEIIEDLVQEGIIL